MVLKGVANVNEFYSAHYLSAILSGDLKTFGDILPTLKQSLERGLL